MSDRPAALIGWTYVDASGWRVEVIGAESEPAHQTIDIAYRAIGGRTVRYLEEPQFLAQFRPEDSEERRQLQ